MSYLVALFLIGFLIARIPVTLFDKIAKRNHRQPFFIPTDDTSGQD